MNHVKELAEQLFKNVCSVMKLTTNGISQGRPITCPLSCCFLLVLLSSFLSHKFLFSYQTNGTRHCFFVLPYLTSFPLSPLLILSLSFPPSRRILTPLWQCTKSSDRLKTARRLHRIRRPSLCWTMLRCSSSSTTLPPSSRLRLLWSRRSSRAWCHLGRHGVSWGED